MAMEAAVRGAIWSRGREAGVGDPERIAGKPESRSRARRAARAVRYGGLKVGIIIRAEREAVERGGVELASELHEG